MVEVETARAYIAEAIEALTLEAYRITDGGEERIDAIEATIAIELERVDCAIGRRGESMFAAIAESIRQAVIALHGAKMALDKVGNQEGGVMHQEKETTPIERAAQAIRDETGAYGHPAGGFMTEGGLVDEQYFRGIARAVLTAIREPSDRPEGWGWEDIPGIAVEYGTCQDGPGKVWRAMIDAALAEAG